MSFSSYLVSDKESVTRTDPFYKTAELATVLVRDSHVISLYLLLKTNDWGCKEISDEGLKSIIDPGETKRLIADTQVYGIYFLLQD